MKKILFLTLCLFISFSSIATTAMANNEDKKPKKDEVSNENIEVIYEDVIFSSPTELSEEQMQDLLEMIKNPTSMETEKSVVFKKDPNPGTITPYVIPGEEYGSTITMGPHYATHSNIEFRAFITGLSYLITRNLKVTTAVADGLVVGTFVVTEKIGPTYTGHWRYKAWDANVGRYREWATLVHYTNNSFITPRKVQVRPLFYY